MPGATPPAAVQAFIEPLKDAISCVGIAHITLSQGARKAVGKTHSWTLNDGSSPVRLSGGLSFHAGMRFEIQDRGQSEGRERYRVSTREYIYSVTKRSRKIWEAHWHPLALNSPIDIPHYHIGGTVLTEDGVYLARAHIPSPRVSIEQFVRFMIEQIGVAPHRDDWSEQLERTESLFREHSSW